MKLSHRPVRRDDFDAFYTAMHGRNPALFDVLGREWRVFYDHGADLTMVVEDSERPQGDRFVGIAQTVFVSDAFVEYVQSGLPPHVNMAASQSMPDGSSPLLSPEQIRAANSESGLNALTTRWGWRNDPPDIEATREIRGFLDRNYPLYYLGYRYKYILLPAYGNWPLEGLLRGGFSLLTDYAEYYSERPPAPEPNERPYLLQASRDVAGSREGSHVSRVFDYTSPRIFYKPHEQELLRVAILGLNDDEAAEHLSISRDAIKMRWRKIYDRTQDVDPSLIPQGGDGTRGAEKRRLLLAYLRDHLEELRPYSVPSG